MRSTLSRPYHIIIADDEDSIRSLLVRVVTRQYPTATISAVPDGAAALGLYDQQGADLLLTNNLMPGITGLELIRILRARQATLPILMVSASAFEQQALAAGATRFLAKPFSVPNLLLALTSLLPP